MRAIWQAAVEAPVVLLLAARTGHRPCPGALPGRACRLPARRVAVQAQGAGIRVCRSCAAPRTDRPTDHRRMSR